MKFSSALLCPHDHVSEFLHGQALCFDCGAVIMWRPSLSEMLERSLERLRLPQED